MKKRFFWHKKTDHPQKRRQNRRRSLLRVVAFSTLMGVSNVPVIDKETSEPAPPTAPETTTPKEPIQRTAEYPHRMLQIITLKENCYNQSYTEVTDDVKNTPVYQSLQILTSQSTYAAKLADVTKERDIYFCNEEEDSAGAIGTYTQKLGRINIDKESSNERLLLTMAHEMIHANQHKYPHLSVSFNSWDFYARARQTLATEAAAEVGEIYVAHQIRQQGAQNLSDMLQGESLQDQYYKALHNGGTYNSIIDAFEQKAQPLKILPTTDQEDIIMAGIKQAWDALFEREDYWKNFYLNRTLKSYIERLAEETVHKGKIESVERFPDDYVSLTGRIDAEHNFTDGLALPPMDDILAYNPDLKAAIESMRLIHHDIALGKDHEDTKALRAELTAQNNPFLTLKPADILQQHDEDIQAKREKTGKDNANIFILNTMKKMIENTPSPAIPSDELKTPEEISHPPVTSSRTPAPKPPVV